MPPSSRKRSKGKERKAKKEAKLKDIKKMSLPKDLQTPWRVWALGSTRYCNHGFDEAVLNHAEHPVYKFIEACWSGGMNIAVLINSHQLYREVWDNGDYKKMMVDILTMIGTNMLLNEETHITWPTNAALTILGVEHGTFNSHYPATKVRDFYPGSRRDALKFFRKRISCSCLKKMHLDARKTFPKTGRCMSCNVEKERIALSVCSRCMVTQFCSRECQVATSSRHREDCDRYVMHEQYNKSRIDA